MAAATTTTSSVQLLLCAAALLAVAACHAAATEVVQGGGGTSGHHGKHNKAGGDVVTNSCANVRAYDWSPQLTRKLCESMLRSEAAAAAAKSPRDLALAAMDLLQSAAAEAHAVLRRHSDDDSAMSKSSELALRYCQLDYAAVARTVPMCRAMVQEYKPIYPVDAGASFANNDYYDCVARLGNAAADCWGHVLADEELAKVVSVEVGRVFQRATLVRAMMEVMIGFSDDNH